MQTAVASPRLGWDTRGADVHRLPWEMTSLQNQKVRQQPAWPKRRRLGMGQVASKALSWGCQGLKKRGVAAGGVGSRPQCRPSSSSPGEPTSGDRVWRGPHRDLGERPGPCYKHETGLGGSEGAKLDEAGRHRGRPVGCAVPRGDSSEDRVWALTMGLTSTPRTICLFCVPATG